MGSTYISKVEEKKPVPATLWNGRCDSVSQGSLNAQGSSSKRDGGNSDRLVAIWSKASLGTSHWSGLRQEEETLPMLMPEDSQGCLATMYHERCVLKNRLRLDRYCQGFRNDGAQKASLLIGKTHSCSDVRHASQRPWLVQVFVTTLSKMPVNQDCLIEPETGAWNDPPVRNSPQFRHTVLYCSRTPGA